MEFRNVTSGGKLDADLRVMPRLLIILCEPLPHLHGGSADDGILRRVVLRIPAKYRDPEQAFLQSVHFAIEAVLDGEAQQIRVSLAIPEQRTGQDALELVANRGPVSRADRPEQLLGIDRWVRLGPDGCDSSPEWERRLSYRKKNS